MKPDDIISYSQLVHEEKANLQRGMNFGIGKGYSVFLMSLRKNAPYADAFDEKTGTLIYEGHDQPRITGGPDPKQLINRSKHRKDHGPRTGSSFARQLILKAALGRSLN